MQGVTRVPGGSVTNEDTSPGPVKRTCGTVVPYIYMYIYNSNPIACDGIRFPTDQWHDPFLSSVISMVTPAWCHGANRGQPCLGWMMTESTTELRHFNLVIRLSKVQQLALLLPAFYPREPFEPASSLLSQCAKPLKHCFILMLKFLKWNMTRTTEGIRPVFFLQVWFLWYLVRLNISCV